MHVCVCACVYTHSSRCIRECVPVYVRTLTHAWISVHVYLFVCVCVCTLESLCAYTHMHVDVKVQYAHVCACVCEPGCVTCLIAVAKS